MNYIIEREKKVKVLLIILIFAMALFIGVSVFIYIKNKENSRVPEIIDVEIDKNNYPLVDTKINNYEIVYVEEYLDNVSTKNTNNIELNSIDINSELDKNEITITEMNKVNENTELSLDEGIASITNNDGNIVITYNGKEYEFYDIKGIYYNDKDIFLMGDKYIYYSVIDNNEYTFYKKKRNNYEKLYYSSIKTNFGSINNNYYDLNSNKIFNNNYFYYIDGDNYIKIDRTYKFNNIEGTAKVILMNNNKVTGIINSKDMLMDFVSEDTVYTSNKKVIMLYTNNKNNIIRFEDNTYYTHKFEDSSLVY